MPDNDNTVEVDATTLAHLTEVARRHKDLWEDFNEAFYGSDSEIEDRHQNIQQLEQEIQESEEALEKAGLI